MAEQFGRVGSNIIRNPFAQAKNDGPQFDDAGKRSPTGGGQQTQQKSQNDHSITNVDDNPGFEPDGVTPKKQVKQGGDGDDPMMNFENLWEDDVIDPAAPKKPEFKGYLPEIDGKVFDDRVSQMDFSKAIKPETMAAILKGGEEAAAAWPDLVNTIGRQAFKMSFNASSKMTSAAAGNIESRFMNDLIPNSIQSRIVDDTLEAGNELAANPKYAPIYKSVKAQYTKKYPKATPQQISNATKAYMEDYVKTASKKDAPVDDNTKKLQKGAGDADWSSWLDT